MSYELIEVSQDDGRPIELYEIGYSGNTWRYTSADRDVTYLASTYKAIPCARGDIQPTSEIDKSSLDFTFPRDAEIGEVFRIQPPSEVVSLTLFGQHYGDVDNQFVTLWKGRIINAEWSGPYIKLTGESVFTSLRRAGLRRRYQLQCPHALFSQPCGVNKDSWKEIHAVQSVSGLTLQVNGASGKPNNYFSGGYVTWANEMNGNIEKRMIRTSSSTGSVVLASAPVGLSGGQLVTLYPGCDHTLGASGCAKFSNVANYGGMPFIPSKNPFGGTAIF